MIFTTQTCHHLSFFSRDALIMKQSFLDSIIPLPKFIPKGKENIPNPISGIKKTPPWAQKHSLYTFVFHVFTKKHTICIYNVKTKRNQHLLFFGLFPPPYCFFVFLNNNLCTCSNPPKKTTTTPQQPPGRRGLHRGGRETEPGGFGGSACAALEGMTDVSTTDRRFPTTFSFAKKKKRWEEKILGWKKKLKETSQL